MKRPRRICVTLVVFAWALSFLGIVPLNSAAENWKTLRNDKYNICIQYPAARFMVFAGASGDGVSIVPKGLAQRARPLPWPDPYPGFGFGGWIVQPKGLSEPDIAGPTRPRTLQEDYEELLQAARDQWHLRHIKIVRKKRIYTQGLPALDVAIEFNYGASGTTWYYREMLVHTPNDSEAYHVSLVCQVSELKNLLPVYEKMAASFRLHCQK